MTQGIERVVACETCLGEGVLWCGREQRLWWVDVLAGSVHEWTQGQGHRIYQPGFHRIGSLALRQQGGLLLATGQGLHAWNPESNATTMLADPEADKPTHRFNDGRCDRAGRFWVSSMNDTQLAPQGALYRIGGGLEIDRMEQDIIIPNAIAFSPDDRTLYFVDTRRYVIWAYDFSIYDGALSERRAFASYGQGPGRPDGSCVDSDGCVWNACYAGRKIIRYRPDGRIDRVLELPVTYPTCCCFGGPDLGTLFITSARFPLNEQELAKEPLAGSVLAIRPGVNGLPEPCFAG